MCVQVAVSRAGTNKVALVILTEVTMDNSETSSSDIIITLQGYACQMFEGIFIDYLHMYVHVEFLVDIQQWMLNNGCSSMLQKKI